MATRIQHKGSGERLGKVSDERKEGEEKKTQRAGGALVQSLSSPPRLLVLMWYKVIYLDLMNIVWIYWKQNEDTFVRLYCCSTRFATTHWSLQGRLIEVGDLENHFGGERFIWGQVPSWSNQYTCHPLVQNCQQEVLHKKMEKGPLFELD